MASFITEGMANTISINSTLNVEDHTYFNGSQV